MRRFEELAAIVNDRVDDPSAAGVDRYVRLEHLDPDSLKIRRWGSPSDVEATKLRFRPGDIIFGRRRAYQRKLAVADFDGICSAHAMVLRAKPDVVLPELLPFLMQSDAFMERAAEISVGSLSPTINWGTLAKERFALPPFQEQRRIAELLGAFEALIDAHVSLARTAELAYKSLSTVIFGAQMDRESLSAGSPLPQGPWVWRRVDECFDLQLGKMSSKESREGRDQVSYVKNNNVLWDRFVLDDLPKMSFDPTERRKFSLRPGDLLVCEGGEIGRAAIWVDVGREMYYQKALHRLRPRTDKVSTRFLLHYLRYCAASGELERIATGTTIMHLPQERLAALRLPFPGRGVQVSLARRLDDVAQAASLAVHRVESLKEMKSRLMKAALVT